MYSGKIFFFDKITSLLYYPFIKMRLRDTTRCYPTLHKIMTDDSLFTGVPIWVCVCLTVDYFSLNLREIQCQTLFLIKHPLDLTFLYFLTLLDLVTLRKISSHHP